MSITWNGVSSDTIGVIVERIPNRYVPTRRFSPQQVAGRNGNILLVDKSFPNVEQEYEVYLSAEAQGLPSVARACAEWLMGPDGYCRLQDSYDTTVYREAFLMGGYDLENILNKFGRCTITFSCKPQKYLLAGDTPISIPAGATTTYTGSSVQFDGITGASITSLSTTITPTQAGSGDPSPTNVRPITGLTGLSVYVSPTQDPDDVTVYNVDWSPQAGTVYSGTVDVVTGVLTVDKAIVDLGSISWAYESGYAYPYFIGTMPNDCVVGSTVQGQISVLCSIYKSIQNIGASEFRTYDHNFQCCLNANVATRRLLVQNSSYTDAATFKTSMNGVQLVYDLETTVTYQLTPQEIGVLVGTNNVWLSDGNMSLTVATPMGGIVTNPTPFEARPLLEVSGVGEITINGKSIQILESVSDFDIDCESMEAEDNSKIYCMDFPELSGGENEIVGDGSITAITVTPRWWTL